MNRKWGKVADISCYYQHKPYGLSPGVGGPSRGKGGCTCPIMGDIYSVPKGGVCKKCKHMMQYDVTF